ncbi:unnamed protein product, partial [Ectocarpus sp. 8 AP-2014]
MEDPADRQAAANGGVGAGVAKDVGAAADTAKGGRTTTTSSCSSSLKLTASVAEETAPTPAPAAGCFLPRQQQTSNAAGHAGGRGTGGTWHEVVELLCDSPAGGVGSAGDDGGRVAAVPERSKIAFKLPPRRSAAAPGDVSKASPLAALTRKRRRGWSVSRRVSCFRESVPVARLHDGSDSSSRSTGGDSGC